MITANDKRTPSPGFSTGTPVQAETSDVVMVQPTTTYMHGSEVVGPSSPPYPLARHLAEELKGHGFATYSEPQPAPVDPPRDPKDDTVEIETETDVEQPDDQSRAPGQDQQTASTVPGRPGADPVRPESGPVPPAATSEAPTSPRRGRGRRGTRSSATVE